MAGREGWVSPEAPYYEAFERVLEEAVEGGCPGDTHPISKGVRGTPIQYRDRLPWPGEKDGCPLRLPPEAHQKDGCPLRLTRRMCDVPKHNRNGASELRQVMPR